MIKKDDSGADDDAANDDVDCGQSDWTIDGSCSATCGDGTQRYTRTTITPAEGAGTACGDLEKFEACNERVCQPFEAYKSNAYCVNGDWTGTNTAATPKDCHYLCIARSPENLYFTLRSENKNCKCSEWCDTWDSHGTSIYMIKKDDSGADDSGADDDAAIDEKECR